MNFDGIENLNDRDVLELYEESFDDNGDKISWRCQCRTVHSNSSCRCIDTTNYNNTVCNFGMTYEWSYDYERTTLDVKCKGWCNYHCGSSSCYGYPYVSRSSSNIENCRHR